MQQELPAVLDAADAKAVTHEMIARAWSDRDRLTLRLPPSSLALKPGDCLQLELSPPQWRVEKTTIDGFVVIAELRPSRAPLASAVGDSGRIVENRDVVAEPLSTALIDVPGISGIPSNDPAVLLAASAPASWQRRMVDISIGAQIMTVEPARAKSIMGRTEGVLAAAAADLIDEQNMITVALVDDDQWLTSCDDDGLAGSENLAVIGTELVQFGLALPLGGGRFRLSRLLRGRFGTEWACAEHSADELFCLLKPGTFQPVVMPNWSIGATLSAAARGGSAASITFVAESLRPPAPVKLEAALQANGDLVMSWIRRSRQGFAWIDGVDAPLGEASEQYRVTLTSSAAAAEFLTTHPTLTVAGTDLAALGGGPLAIDVCQVGDAAASRATRLTLDLS